MSYAAFPRKPALSQRLIFSNKGGYDGQIYIAFRACVQTRLRSEKIYPFDRHTQRLEVSNIQGDYVSDFRCCFSHLIIL